MEYVLRVSKKGQIAIPVEVRRRFKIKSRVVLKVEGKEIKICPFKSMEEAFGLDGKKMIEVAKSLLEEKRRELKLEG